MCKKKILGRRTREFNFVSPVNPSKWELAPYSATWKSSSFEIECNLYPFTWRRRWELQNHHTDILQRKEPQWKYHTKRVQCEEFISLCLLLLHCCCLTKMVRRSAVKIQKWDKKKVRGQTSGDFCKDKIVIPDNSKSEPVNIKSRKDSKKSKRKMNPSSHRGHRN